ncbi:hypothetical protein SETIT_3G249200v2 [Setaria italica]|uniref:Uncharacterized protein n=1 Tax=Setaria italica TaxID=4555 RepID=K3Z7B9_SETIT|nr:uncharacterized protein LOC101766062 [Setaria italica]RCV17807.1 hypothetical protein SETIT_3G249200v2 [Setaria italica]
MAFQTPAAVLLNENMQIHKGKRAEAPSAKPLKPSAKPVLQERKALQDVSNIPKGTALNNRSAVKERSILKDKFTLKDRSILKERPALHNVSNTLKERSILKQKPALGSHEAIKNPVNVFADEETKKCHEWAKDGVEGTNFTGNDSQKLDKDMQDKRVQKKVVKVMSAFNGWSDVVFDPVMFPAKEVANFSEEVKELELEPEILPDNTRCLFTSGKRADAPTAKQLKSSVKPRLQERKALQDLSNTLSGRKDHQDISNTLKEKSILKERPSLRRHEAIKNPLKIFAVEETKKCHEWAKDVVEGTHLTGNYPQKLDKDVQEERDKAQLAEDSSTDDELDEYPFLDNNPVTFELRDEPGIPELRAN